MPMVRASPLSILVFYTRSTKLHVSSWAFALAKG